MTSYKNTAKRIWEETPAGKIQVKMNKVYNRVHDKRLITKEDVRWLDIHHATAMSKDKDLMWKYEEEEKKLKEKFRKEYDDLMIGVFQEELDYLLKIEQRERQTD